MTSRTLPVAAAVAGVLLWLTSIAWRWRIIEYRPGPLGSATRNIAGAAPGVGLYLVGVVALVLLVVALLLTGGRSLRWPATALAGALALLLAWMASTLTSYAGDDRIAHVRPGPAFAVAAAALATLLLAIWTAPTGTPGGRAPVTGSWIAGLAGLLAGLAALLASCYLPLWRDTYPDMESTTPAADGYWALVPAALIPGILTTVSLVRSGDEQRVARRICAIWLMLTAAGCGALITMFWLFSAGDPYHREHEMVSTRPGVGLLLAYIAHLLIAAGGAVSRASPRQGRSEPAALPATQ